MLAAQMLALSDERIAGLLKQARSAMKREIEAKNEKIRAEADAL